VTFSVVVSAARLGTSGVMDAYRALAGGIVAALRRLGLDAGLVERSSGGVNPAAARDPACFAVKARCDLVVGSAKLVGSAQVQRNGFVLQQNSLPLRIRLADWDDVFLRPTAPPEATGLWEAAGREVGYGEVAAALREGFAEALGIGFAEGGLSKRESERVGELREVAAVSASRAKARR
jgi:lipoate-protein ligase A